MIFLINLGQIIIPDLLIAISLLLLLLFPLLIWFVIIIFKKRTRALFFNETLYHNIFDQATIGIAVVDYTDFEPLEKLTFLYTNPMFQLISGRNSEELIDIKWGDIIHPEDKPVNYEIYELLKTGKINSHTMEKRVIRPDGSLLWVSIKLSLFSAYAGAITTYLCLLEDISERKKVEKALVESERSKSVLFSHLQGMAYRCHYDREWTMEFVSAGCEELTGYKPENLLNNHTLSFNDVIAPEYRETLWREWANILSSKENFRSEYEIITKSGKRKWVLELGQGVYDEYNNIEALEGIIFDISEQKKREEKIIYLSEHDYLTDLFNRNYLEKEKSKLDRPENWPLSMAICDIDALRMINDAYGYTEGDKVIIRVAQLIASSCRPHDILFRVGGDEFMLIMPNTDNETAKQQVDLIKDTIDKYNLIKKLPMYDVNVSIGYSTKESHQPTMEVLIKNTEEILKHRKLLNQKSSHYAILSSVMATLYAKSQETEEHGQRLAKLTNMVAEFLSLDEKNRDSLKLLSMLHDIGKIGIDDSILNKPGKLTDQEWLEMKKHPEIGHHIAMSTPELEHIALYILHHHERWDGKGYPNGIKNMEIPLLSRILAVADAYDAMTEDRVYRKALTPEAALEEIKRGAGTQFDPDIARLFVELLPKRQDLL